jgi:ABC-type transport system involved in cytochrome bd biosynthesis fused ATPase/permease subunit
VTRSLARQAVTDAQIVDALDGVQLADWVAGLPEGLDGDLRSYDPR